ncbi:MAG: hypothetical protein J1E00_07710 [Oscillospiraceae bacterium]|nr:hypothetical protein [Oscillospiraceae bacterium]
MADTFISSPSNQDAPKLENVVVDPADWDGEIIVTRFADRDTLPDEELEKLMAAYELIKSAEAVDELHEELAELAETLGVPVEKLAVSTLFNVHATKEGLNSATLTLSSPKFNNFVSLLHFDGEEWDIVETTVEDLTITFTAEGFSPYAVVVSTEDIPDAPITGEALPVVFIVLAVLFGAAGVCFFAKSKANA